MRGYTQAEESLKYTNYLHWVSEERGIQRFLREYASALFGEFRLAWKVWWRHRFKVIHLAIARPAVPDCAPFKLLGSESSTRPRCLA